MANDSIFADDWRECLQAQYQHVIRNNDQITLKTLVPVLHDVGFSEDELRELAFRATLRAEDVADDFVPDMEIMSGAQPVAKPEPAPEVDITPPEDVSSDDLGLTLEETLAVVGAALADDAGELPTEALDEAETDDEAAEPEAPQEPEPKLPPGMQQLSLF